MAVPACCTAIAPIYCRTRKARSPRRTSISAGLDYPGIGPEHSWLKEKGRVEYVSATDDEALEAFQLLCKIEGIIPALESSHALAHTLKLAPSLSKDNLLVMNLSGRGDKDVPQIAERLGIKI